MWAGVERVSNEAVTMPLVQRPARSRNIGTRFICYNGPEKLSVNEKLNLNSFPGRAVIDRPTRNAVVRHFSPPMKRRRQHAKKRDDGERANKKRFQYRL